MLVVESEEEAGVGGMDRGGKGKWGRRGMIWNGIPVFVAAPGSAAED